ncbi:site-2 protease family protein [Streptomyces paradoxus]|uniref:Zn-dependent protease n=1 Tax=Streptomyces paradoxus TaxID=66375 RepID=A0A7W9WJF9_9ACTN|nr:site-2 protease family protein [Streptomyces paradoxus]MBB6078500.1 Zn-dependent protease [Streptomyces paradoxus]
MDESGGRGQPRSGNDESAERHEGLAPRATGPAPADEQPTPTDEHGSAPEQPTPGPEPTGHVAPADVPASDTPATPPDASAPPRPSAAGASPDPRTPNAVPARAGGEGDGSPEGGTHPDPARADGLPAAAGGAVAATAASAPAEGDGDGSPEADTHPERAYAGDPHAAPTAGRPEADRLRKGPAPDQAPGSGDAHRRQQPPTLGPGDANRGQQPAPTAPAGHPNHRPGPSAPAPGDRPLAHSADGKGPAPQRPEPRGGLLMGRPFGVPVYVAPSWFLVAALITWVFGGQLERVLPELGAARYLVSLFFAVAFYASVLVHELAHTVAALRFKLPVRRIQLQFFGGVSEIEKEAETPGREFILAFVGPLLSLVLAGLFYGAAQTVEPGTVPGVLLAGLMISNLIVAAFNLLPGLPLDGGRMLRAIVWKITGKPMKGTIAAAWVGRALAVSVLIGLPLLTQSGALGTDAADNVGMDTVLDALLAAILAAIIWTGAGNSLRMARLREHLPELRARALTRRAVPVETDTPLSEALRRANAAGARALVVVDADGQPLSLVREAAIVGVPEHRRPWVAVSGLAQDLTDGMRVSAELSGEELLDALRATPATEYLVVEETGEIYGVLSAADVERAFVKAMARPS